MILHPATTVIQNASRTSELKIGLCDNSSFICQQGKLTVAQFTIVGCSFAPCV